MFGISVKLDGWTGPSEWPIGPLLPRATRAQIIKSRSRQDRPENRLATPFVQVTLTTSATQTQTLGSSRWKAAILHRHQAVLACFIAFTPFLAIKPDWQ